MLGQSDEIFLIEGERLRSLPARPFRAGLFGKTLEEALQTLLEKYPELLPGKQMDPESDDPPRFVLLRREMPVGAWAIDHLLVDQQGVLTLVETKLVQNPEARREVIGQIMEYAANSANSWGNGQARQKAEEFWSKQGKNVDDVIRAKFGGDVDIEAFWSTVEENLRQGKIRLVVLGDELRPEVRRIIEYLNAEMSTAEIYGLELRCYADESSHLVLVPHLVGQTQAIADRKGPTSLVTLWTVDRLRSAYDNLSDRDAADRLGRMLTWAMEAGSFLEARARTPHSVCGEKAGLEFSPSFRMGHPIGLSMRNTILVGRENAISYWKH